MILLFLLLNNYFEGVKILYVQPESQMLQLLNLNKKIYL